MKHAISIQVLLSLMLMQLFAVPALAQSQTLGSTMDVYVFPADGQDSSQQSKDEAECYEWATSNVGVDPFELEKQAQANEQQALADQQAAEQTAKGSAAKGAVRGAATGAVIGEIADDDASHGAAVGATAGVVHGRRKGRQARAQAEQQAAAQAQQRESATDTELTNFKNAFGVCLEAKEYMVKF